MEIPSKVSIFNSALELKGKPGTLVSVDERGFYEVIMDIQARTHRILFPIQSTVVIFNDAVPQIAADFEIER